MNNRWPDDRRVARCWICSTLLAVVLGLLTAGCSSSAAPKSAGGAFQSEPQSVSEWVGNPQPKW